jgi:hypothetical protein
MTQLHFDINFYKKQDKFHHEIDTAAVPKNGNLAEPLKQVISRVKITLEKLITTNYSVTTYEGIFALVYADNQKNPVVMIEYRPAFNYKEYYTTRDINDMVSAICPGGLNQ